MFFYDPFMFFSVDLTLLCFFFYVFAGGYSSLRFHTTDKFGHAALEIELEDDDQFYEPATTRMSFKIEAANIDRFVQKLRNLEKNKSGEATLPMRSNQPLVPIS
jgi:hypothetical protein